MDNNPHRLLPAAQLAQQRKDAAGRLLAQWEERVRQHGLQLEELRRYRRDYLQQWAVRSPQGLHGFELRDYQTFLARLDTAIRTQEARLAELRGQRDRRHREWLAAHAHREALERLIQHDLATAARRRERREQEESDDRAQRGSPFGWQG
jgi:flagellar FliJ protein